ncbi:hypothetical protein ABEB36_003976 [Hypothenemus hampei]|uniref:Uncharacterized protein n=1 Tax=Hypothenemus hampei TaxID=57062 RepID=A0ABD1F4X6_HYPHA
MKSLVLFVSFLVGINALDQSLIEEKKQQIIEWGLECAESEKATPEDIEALKNHQPPVSHQGRCLLFCVNKKLQLMNEDGSINVPHTTWLDKVKADDSELFEKLSKVYHSCIDKVTPKSDGCDTALDLVSCLKEEGEKDGLNKIFHPDRK